MLAFHCSASLLERRRRPPAFSAACSAASLARSWRVLVTAMTIRITTVSPSAGQTNAAYPPMLRKFVTASTASALFGRRRDGRRVTC